ncbi:MAG: metallophosphoesterase [archaeon]
MKLLVFTDHHGSPDDLRKIAEKIPMADTVICLGDFTIFEHEIEYIMGKMNKLGKKILLIHGNHEDEDTVAILCKHFKNLEFIHKKVYKLGNYLFVAYGGGGFSTHEPTFEAGVKNFKPEGKKVVLLTHGPPYGTKLDKLSMGYVGNKSFTAFIKKFKPVLAVSGHLHETFGAIDKIGPTVVINPGPEGMLIEI